MEDMMIVFPWQGYDVSPDDGHDGDGYVECEIMIDINTWYNCNNPL